MLVLVVLYDEVVAPFICGVRLIRLRCCARQMSGARAWTPSSCAAFTEAPLRGATSCSSGSNRGGICFIFSRATPSSGVCPPFVLVFSRSRRGLCRRVTCASAFD